jgi:phosphoribosylformylglycinamidine synthase
MAKVKALILRTAGTNCDWETEYALRKAGAEAHRLHVQRLLERIDLLRSYHLFVLPGGFTYGDDIAAGKVLANLLRFHLVDVLEQFLQEGKLVMGICNGFQALVKGRLLPAQDSGLPEATLTFNDSNRFEARWVHLKACSSKSVYIEEGEQLYLPVAHAEGKFVPRDDATLQRLRDSSQIVFRYVNEQGERADYPDNPNGSVEDIAGICDPTGRILGMMPHPERYVEPYQHPSWYRNGLKKEPDGLKLFLNAVRYVKKNLL